MPGRSGGRDSQARAHRGSRPSTPSAPATPSTGPRRGTGRGDPLPRAAAWANAAAALAVTRPGAQSALPYRAEIDSLAEAQAVGRLPNVTSGKGPRA